MPIARLFPHLKDGKGIVYTAVFCLTLILTLLLLLPERSQRAVRPTSFIEALLWAFLGIIGLFLVQFIATFINVLLLHQAAPSTHTQDIVNLTRASPLFIFTVSVIGPMLEEIVFRKIFFGSLRSKMPFIIAAAISSFVFAVVHMDLSHLLTYFLIGFFLCYVYARTGRIWVTMIMHAGMNSIVILVNLAIASTPLIMLWPH